MDEVALNKKKHKHRYENKMSSDIGSVPDTKILPFVIVMTLFAFSVVGGIRKGTIKKGHPAS